MRKRQPKASWFDSSIPWGSVAGKREMAGNGMCNKETQASLT